MSGEKKAPVSAGLEQLYSEEAERGVLACLLQWAEESAQVLGEARLDENWFYDLRHRHAYVCAAGMYEAGETLDALTFVARLTAQGKAEECGGLAYVMGLPDAACSVAQLPAFVETMRQLWLRRQVMRLATDARERASNLSVSVAEAVSVLADGVGALEEGAAARKEEALGAILPRVVAALDDYHRGHAQVRGLTLGFDYVDKMLCGIGGARNNMVVLAARPGQGKTSFALDVAGHVAMDLEAQGEDGAHRKGLPVVIFSMEMTAEAVIERLLFQRARADLQRWRTGMAKKEDQERLTRVSAELKKAPIWVDDTGRMTIEELRAKARRLKRQVGAALFIVDYIQLMRVGGKRYREDRVQELAEISGEIQKLGKELQTPFLVLAQMNRDYEKEPNRAPRLADLKDCGAIEQDADVVAFLYATRKLEEDEQFQAALDRLWPEESRWREWSAIPSRVNLLIAKSRNGPTGDCQLLFFKSSTHFVDYVRWLKETGSKELSASERRREFEREDELV